MPLKRYNLISFAEVDSLSQKTIVQYYQDHISPGIATFLKILGFSKYKIVRAEGMYLYTECGRKILDFSGGLSVLNHGHNHPRILETRRKFNDEKRLEICKAFISQYQSVLARNLAEIFGNELTHSFFCNSGAEANEGALKIALLYQRLHKKDKIIYTDLGYHGKTFGTMSVSGDFSKPYKELFKTLEGCLEVKYGDVGAVADLIRSRSSAGNNDIAAMILEPIKADLVLAPPQGYLKELVDLCKKNDILLIFDEVFTGFGRTGEMFAFEHEGVKPDIVTFSKSLGGGKASIAGYIVRSDIFKKTYGPLERCLVHSTTFGGLGEECATAIEALNIINDEGLVENARVQGLYLLSRLEQLKNKYPRYIKGVRAIGLLGAIDFHESGKIFGLDFMRGIPKLSDAFIGLFPAVVVSEMFSKEGILVYVGGKEDYLCVNPSLIVTREQIDIFVDALDRVLRTNIYALATKLAGNYLSFF